ncbi:hypothetical protein IAU60_000597 [Kwoniella sp. DSM 27419]
MTAYLASYIPAIQSVLPRSSPTTAELPSIGSPAPALPNVELKGHPTLVAFVRHCGCPFAEKEVHNLAEQMKRNQELHVVIVQHSEEKQTREWFEAIDGPQLFTDSSRLHLIPDPQRELYAKWGIGALGWGGMINSTVMESLKTLKAEDGIDLRPTGEGSWRWQNSGGFAVDDQGTVRWNKVAKDSSDVCDYAAAARTIL